MDFGKQTDRAADIHRRFLISGEATCIDCHKGIAHQLPNMENVEPGWIAPAEMRSSKAHGSDPDAESVLRYLASLDRN